MTAGEKAHREIVIYPPTRGLATQGFGQHTGILVALTDLDLALQLADALLILHAGRAAWQGAVADYVATPPAVEQWGLHQPVLVALARRLRETGWCLRLDDSSPEALGQAIAAHVRVVRR